MYEGLIGPYRVRGDGVENASDNSGCFCTKCAKNLLAAAYVAKANPTVARSKSKKTARAI